MQELKKVYDVLSSISSKKGFKVDKFTITAKSPVTAQITMSDGEVNINFTDNTPVVTVRKIIKISISVLGITLTPTGGIVRLDDFPDIPFDYDEDGKISRDLSQHWPGL